MILRIPLEIKSWNKFLGRSHWAMVKEKGLWKNEIFLALAILRGNGHFPRDFLQDKKRRIEVTSYRRRKIDQDNICLKPVLDALKSNGLIQDDSPKWIDLKPVKQIKGKGLGTEIVIA